MADPSRSTPTSGRSMDCSNTGLCASKNVDRDKTRAALYRISKQGLAYLAYRSQPGLGLLGIAGRPSSYMSQLLCWEASSKLGT